MNIRRRHAMAACVLPVAGLLVAVATPAASAGLSPAISSVGGSYTAVPVHALPVVSVPAGGGVRVPVTGVPSLGVGSVVLTTSVSDASSAGRVTIGRTGAPHPDTPALLFDAGQSVSNQVIVPLGSSGGITVFSSATAVVSVALTVTGYLVAGAPRMAGTFGAAAGRVAAVRVPARSSSTVPVAGVAGIPAGVSDAVFQVSVPKPTAAGSVSVVAAGASAPDVANAVFAVGRPAVSLAEVALGDGSVTVFNTAPRSELIDLFLVGYHRGGTPAANGVVHRLTPRPWIDTTMGTGLHDNRVATGKAVWTFAGGRAGVPAEGVRAVVVTLQVTSPTTAGHLSAYPTGDPAVGSALTHDQVIDNPTVTFAGGRGTASATTAILNVGDGGKITFVNHSAGTLHLVADVVGYVTGPGGFTWSPPRVADVPGAAVDTVSCVSAKFCLAADPIGRVYRWDGARWSAPTFIADHDVAVSSLSCATTSFCVAVTSDARGAAFVWRAGEWSSSGEIAPAPLTFVTCRSTDFCAAVGREGTALFYRDGMWGKPVQIEQDALVSVSCASTIFCAAVDIDGGALIYSASGWAHSSRSSLTVAPDRRSSASPARKSATASGPACPAT